MKSNFIVTSSLLILACFLIVGCAATDTGIPEDAALVVVGKVDKEIGWVEADIQAMEMIGTESKNSKGELESYTGVPIKGLLDLAGVKPDATTVAFISEDGSVAEADLAEILACENCILSSRKKGGFRIVAPGFGDDIQVKGVVKIEIK